MKNVLTNTKIFDIIVSVTRKYPCGDAAMAQLVEHILGKDEVPGPNPGSSSRQPRRETFGALVFMGICYPLRAATRHGPGKDTNLLRSFLVLKSPPDSSQSESISNIKTISKESFWALVFYKLVMCSCGSIFLNRGCPELLLSLHIAFCDLSQNPVRIPHVALSSLLVSSK